MVERAGAFWAVLAEVFAGVFAGTFYVVLLHGDRNNRPFDNRRTNIYQTVMDEEAVRAYVEHAEATIEAAPQMGEATTKAAVLREFLDILGWEIPANTQLEYSVEAFGRTFRVDYALVLEGAPVAFLEAKGVDTSLTEEHRTQIQEYMKSEDVNLGILTNGEEYAFFRREVVNSKVNVNTLAEIPLAELPDRITILRAFTKDAIQNDEWVKILNRIRELKDARATLENEKDDLAIEIAELLADSVSDAIASPAESQAKEMIDRLKQDIADEIDTEETVPAGEEVDVVAHTEPETTIDDSAEATTGDSDELEVEMGDSDELEVEMDDSGEYVIKIRDGETVLASFVDDNQSDVMADAVGHLIEERDLISKLEPLPFVPGRKNAIINDEPVHPDGEREMEVYRELPGGYYLCTKLGKSQKSRYVDRLADECGLDVDFEGRW